MRIACIHIPQFALQCATRLDPSLRGEAVAVVSTVGPARDGTIRAAGVLHAPIVLACSRAAWAVGVRLGMTATAARRLSPERELHIVTAEPVLEREAIRAVADSLLAQTGLVDVGGRVGAGAAHLAMYAEVPAKTRGATFGERLVSLLDGLGFAARIGIADDRFTAWVAAAHSGADDREVITVPRGGSAAFLAPRPLSLLAIPTEVQHMLEALGVRTLGEFASLPAPSVARPFEADYQALARGESGSQLRPYAPEAPIREDVIVSAGNVLELDGMLGGTAAIAMIARRIAHRLEGRGRLAARLEVSSLADVSVVRESADERPEIPVTLDHPVSDAEDLARALGPVLEATSALTGTWRLRVVVTGEALADGVGLGADVVNRDSVFAESTSAMRGQRSSERADGGLRGDLGGLSAHSGSLSPLAVVLSSTGSLFALSAPQGRDERRDTHRRTRRGKQRRARPSTLAQPKLFDRALDRSSSK